LKILLRSKNVLFLFLEFFEKFLMQNWRKISFSTIFEKLNDIERIKYSIKTLGYFPAVFGYGVEIILLLKISQFVLGWHF
jgi:hypothetical protein